MCPLEGRLQTRSAPKIKRQNYIKLTYPRLPYRITVEHYCMKHIRICKYLNSLFLIANGYMNESIAEFCFEFEYKVSIDIAKNRIFYVIKSTRNAVMQWVPNVLSNKFRHQNIIGSYLPYSLSLSLFFYNACQVTNIDYVTLNGFVVTQC